MSHGSYNLYNTKRKAYETEATCIAAGPKGHQGFQGQDGEYFVAQTYMGPRGYTGFQGFTGLQGTQG